MDAQVIEEIVPLPEPLITALMVTFEDFDIAL
jgi:hypothetical protein